MKKYAILCGSAPNGVSKAMLSFMLERIKAEKTEQILLYICTLSPVAEDDKSVWLGGEEVRKSVIEAFCADGHGQVIYDCGGEMVRDEEREGVPEDSITSFSFAKAEN